MDYPGLGLDEGDDMRRVRLELHVTEIEVPLVEFFVRGRCISARECVECFHELGSHLVDANALIENG